MTSKPRLGEIEILRGMAFAAVVLQHSIAHYSVTPELGTADGVRLTLLLIAAKFAVPAFIFITGLVLFYNYDGELAYGSFIRKRFKDIVVPYVIWSLLYMVMNGILLHQPPLWWLPDMLKFWITGKSSYHLWYIVMIIPMYLLFPLLRKLVRRLDVVIHNSGRRALLAVVGLTVGYEALLLLRPWLTDMFNAWQVPGLSAYFTIYADRNIVYYLYYFILGALAGLHITAFLKLLQTLKWPIVISCVIFTLYYAGLVLGGQFPPGPGFGPRFMALILLQPWMALFLVSLVLGVYMLALNINQTASSRQRQMWVMLSRYSYGGYLAHALMLQYAYVMDDWLFSDWNSTLRTILVWIMALILSVAVTYGLSRLKFGTWLTGIPYRKAR